MVLGESVRRYRPEARDQALLLAALYRQVFSALRADLLLPDSLAPRRRWRRARQPELRGIDAVRLQVRLFGPANPLRPAMATRRLLTQLPGSFVADVTRWSPPVVASFASSSDVLVVENVVSGFLAGHCLAGHRIHVRVLRAATLASVTLADLALAWLPQLHGIVEANAARVMAIAPDARLGELLSGRRRAMVARVRQRAGAGGRRMGSEGRVPA
jgi:hypothetical protein